MKNKKNKSKSNKYFVGGAVNQGISGITGAFGMDKNAAGALGGVGQAAVGAISGNPMDIMSGAGSLLDAGISGLTNTLQQKQQEKAEINNIIRQNNMANGGNLSERLQRIPFNYPKYKTINTELTNPVLNQQLVDIPQRYNVQDLTNINDYNRSKLYEEDMLDYYQRVNPHTSESRPLRGITNRPAANPGQVEQGILRAKQIIQEAEGRKRKPARLFEDGGMLNKFNGGDLHENMLLGGIPQGIGPNGKPNTTEQGETRGDIFNTFTGQPESQIFSDDDSMRFKKNDRVSKNWIGKTPSEISEKINKPLQDYPNDPLWEEQVNNELSLLAEFQDDKRSKKNQNNFKKGGNMYPDGGGIFNQVSDELTNQLLQEEIQKLNDSVNLTKPKYGTGEALGTGDNYRVMYPGNEDYDLYKKYLQDQFNTDAGKDELLELFNPENPINQSGKRKEWLDEIRMKHPEFLNNPDELIRLASDEQPGPVHSLISYNDELESINPLKGTEPSGELAEVNTRQPDETKERIQPAYDPRAEWMRFAPLASPLLTMGSPELNKFTPNTMTTGYLRPQQIDEQTLLNQANMANRAQIGSLSDVTGGSGSAQRAMMMGQGSNYMDNISNAFMQAAQFNKNAQQQADQFNIGTQGNVAARNMQTLNKADMYNTQAQNALNQEMYDTRLRAGQNALDSLGNIGQENMARNMYDKSALQTAGATGEEGFVQGMPNTGSRWNRFFGTQPRQTKYGGAINTSINKSGMKSNLL